MTREEILEQLYEMNQEIEQLIEKRTEFIYSHIEEASEFFKVGEEYANLATHEVVTVKELYTSSSVGKGKGGYHDNSLRSIHAQFSNGDNSSRYSVHPFVSKKDFDEKNDNYVKKLEYLAYLGGKR